MVSVLEFIPLEIKKKNEKKMKKIIRLTENDLIRLVKRVILEQENCAPIPQEFNLEGVRGNSSGGPVNGFMSENGYSPGASNNLPIVSGTYKLAKAGQTPEGMKVSLAYVVDQKGCFTGYVIKVNNIDVTQLVNMTLNVDESKFPTLSDSNFQVAFSYQNTDINYPEEQIQGIRN
jgi:hypothetical protein